MRPGRQELSRPIAVAVAMAIVASLALPGSPARAHHRTTLDCDPVTPVYGGIGQTGVAYGVQYGSPAAYGAWGAPAVNPGFGYSFNARGVYPTANGVPNACGIYPATSGGAYYDARTGGTYVTYGNGGSGQWPGAITYTTYGQADLSTANGYQSFGPYTGVNPWTGQITPNSHNGYRYQPQPLPRPQCQPAAGTAYRGGIMYYIGR
jgi:hypothetical protein